MEKPPVKLNELSPIIISLIEKIQLLDSPHLMKQEKLSITKEMLEIVDNFREFFVKASDSDNSDEVKIFNERIERAFSIFDWASNVSITPFEFDKFSENGKLLISSILKVLGIKGCGVLIIETYLKLCLKVLYEMAGKVDNINISSDKDNFKSILEAFSITVNMLKKYWHIAFFPNQKSAIMLCLHQICKLLTFLLKMIKFQNVDLRKYALNLLAKCLHRMQSEIHNKGSLQTNDCGQEFITLMDHCLYKLSELSTFTKDFPSFIQKANATTTVLKPMIDELLCYVMSIAHVTTFENDSSAILLSSQKVLREFNDLINEIKKENGWEIKLNASSVGESLCNLERQVNTAVLRLVMEVFSNINSPLKNIVNKCRIDIGKDNKASEDLNILISDFDSEMDRIMQIGLFAISCTSSLNRILEIRSCLASLESLEIELIPSLTALYVDCTPKNKAKFQYLIDFWLNEITELKTLIDSILDPAGFCGVVENQVKTLGKQFKELATSNVSPNQLKQILKQIVRYSRKLIKTLKTSMKDENGKNDETDEYISKFHLAVEECVGVLGMLEEGQDTNKISGLAMKRCDSLLETLSALSLLLFSIVYEDNSEYDPSDELQEKTLIPQIPQKDYYKLCEPSDINVTPSEKTLEILTPYIDKGILRSRKRNILYTTPTKTERELEENVDGTMLQARHWDKTPVSRKRSRCCKPLNLNLELENTIDLEITTILENISRLSTTFSKGTTETDEKEEKSKPDKEEPKKSGIDVACGMEKDTDCVKPTYSSSGCCAKLDSIENEKDEKPEVDREEEENSLGKKLRNRFIQSLNDLSLSSSLFVSKDDETTSQVDTPIRVNDIKVVEERINFLKQQVPCILP